MALLYVYASGFGQSNALDYRQLKEPYFIDSWFKKDVPLGRVLNYKDSVITLNDFKDKLIILDFWFTHCTDCIAQFPKEDSLQTKYSKDIQFILVTFDSAEQVKKFFSFWEQRTNISLPFPMIVEDTILGKLFRHLYDPHYVWIFPDGKIVGQTSEHFVTADNISGMLKEWVKRKAFFKELNKGRALENAASQKTISNTKTNSE